MNPEVVAPVQRKDGSTVQINDRIHAEGYYATVKFIGHVPPTAGVWLGVQWDVDGRGKHDGTKDGVRYFHTRNSTSGSFVRPGKVDLGVACLTAITNRYGKDDGEITTVIHEGLFVMDDRKKAIPVEMIGMQKVNEQQSQLHYLRKVVVREKQVYGSSQLCNLALATPNIQELDLSKTLLPDWGKVAGIVAQLPECTYLDVSENRLSLPDDPSTLAPSFANIHTVFINYMDYSWEQILQCSEMLPKLSVLHACFNNMTHLSPPSPHHLRNVTLVNLDGNPLAGWDEVLKLGTLPCLKSLILNSTGLSHIHFPDSVPQCNTAYFSQIHDMSLSSNNFSSWEGINELSKLPSLRELRMSKNPLNTLDTPAGIRNTTIARVGGLTSYNRSKLDRTERSGAEYEYVKLNYTEWKNSGGNIDPKLDETSLTFITSHPRLPALVRLYGEPERGELKTMAKTIGDNLIAVTISDYNKDFKKKLPIIDLCGASKEDSRHYFLHCPQYTRQRTDFLSSLNNLNCHVSLNVMLNGDTRLTDEVNGEVMMAVHKYIVAMTIQKLLRLVQRLYKIHSDADLSYSSHEVPGLEIDLDNTLRDLSYYSVENNDTILVKWRS